MGAPSGRRGPLVSVEELAEEIATRDDLVVIDVRWRLGAPPLVDEYRDGHVPGAVFVSLDDELAGPPRPGEGRHPLPDAHRLEAAVRRWGVRRGGGVVAYDDSAGLAAARAWWLLRDAGLEDVRVLDGGLEAWRRAGLPIAVGDEATETGDVELSPGHLPVVGVDEAAALAASGVLLDARATPRYRGEVEPVDPRAGHIPGAVSAPTTENLGPQGRFRPSDELAERFRALGVVPGAPVGVYCGSGVTAAHEVLALELAGIPAALFPGSWSQWAADPARPVATGDAP